MKKTKMILAIGIIAMFIGMTLIPMTTAEETKETKNGTYIRILRGVRNYRVEDGYAIMSYRNGFGITINGDSGDLIRTGFIGSSPNYGCPTEMVKLHLLGLVVIVDQH